jgi:integrase/recombinase XerD
MELHGISPADVGRYLDGLATSVASKKQVLAALRNFFDCMVTRHAVVLNPALSVRGERYSVLEGKTPEITVKQARKLMHSIDTADIVGLRDKCIIAVLIYTAARVGAVSKLRLKDLYDAGDQYCLHFDDKGGKSREIPVRHDLQTFLISYLQSSKLQIGQDASRPLFTTAIRNTKRLSDRPLSADDIGRMVKRRLVAAGLPTRLSPHSFRVATITDLLEQGVSLENVQSLAGHADPRTTRLYDRRHKKVTRNIVERISI